jgi:predicted TIM-barrel fold metal-dependent hydrolase
MKHQHGDAALGRRGILSGGAVVSLTALGLQATAPGALAQEVIQHSAGTGVPRLKLPANACDSHMHFYHTRYPLTANVLRPSPDATIEEYRKLQRRNGSSRTVVVTPSAYGTDNSASLDGMAALGADSRGVAVVIPSVTDAELQRLHGLGVRGIRFNLATPGTTTWDMVAPLSQRVAALGWHTQMHMTADQIVAVAAQWPTLAAPVVFDHMGRIPKAAGTGHPAFRVLAEGLARGKTWIKLSGSYMDTASGPPSYADSVALGRAFAAASPERMVWGSDWPHPTQAVGDKPDDAVLVDLMAEMVPDEKARHLVFVDNPARLYDFPL